MSSGRDPWTTNSSRLPCCKLNVVGTQPHCNLFVVWRCFLLTTVELSSFSRDCMACKGKTQSGSLKKIYWPPPLWHVATASDIRSGESVHFLQEYSGSYSDPSRPWVNWKKSHTPASSVHGSGVILLFSPWINLSRNSARNALSVMKKQTEKKAPPPGLGQNSEWISAWPSNL